MGEDAEQQQYDHDDDEDDEDEDMLTVLTQPKRSKKIKSHAGEPLSGRLDFRPTMTDQVPESQLKSMSPKERRQLRNKISARNFRNRRKQYITTIEEELDKYKDENKKLHSELNMIREQKNKLQEENKQLKLDLILYQENMKSTTNLQLSPNNTNELIQTIQANSSVNTNNSVSTIALPSFELSSPSDAYHTSDSSDSPPNLNMFDDFNIQQQQQQPFSLPSQQSQLPTDSQFWDLSTLPTLPSFNIQDMYLNHAMMPTWNINNVLSKANEQTSPNNNSNTNVMEVFQKYPLLAPALMSIVVGHTMTLSANDLLNLNYSTTTTTTNNKDIVKVGDNSYPIIHGLDDKQTLKIWELLEPITENINNAKISTITDEEDKEEKEEITSTADDSNKDDDDQKSDTKDDVQYTSWAHRYLKTYVCSYVHSYIEHCRIYNSIKKQQTTNNDETIRPTTYRRPCFLATPSTPLCKQLKRAKERFIPVS
ncbi:hypothetical protein BJ944DRAFT_265231 [Cunninghamella echinulata]|nr:hypothetical protein BJ944DRAFT_265231 [Cunninghamella echinulata]